MPIWPFGRKSRQGSKIKPEHLPVTAEAKRPVGPYSGPASNNMSASTQAVGRQLSRRRSSRRSQRQRTPTRGAQLEKEFKDKDMPDMSPISPISPVDTALSEKLHPRPQGSVEDITALPVSKELGTSPHLRPVTRDADIPYNFQLHTASQASIPSARERGKLQRPQSRNKRSANDSALPKRKPSKKRKDDHVREEEIRAMSAPMNVPKRPDSSLMRRDSKRMRSGLNRHLERPVSNVSLPLEESIHSSMSGNSDHHAFMLSAVSMLAPRPVLRASLNSQYTAGGLNSSMWNASGTETRSPKRPTPTREVLKESRTIDALADDLDATALRELMERDQRRRDAKRKREEERVRRRLERREAKQRAKEAKREQEAAAAAAATAVHAQKSLDQQRDVGLGIDTTAAARTTHPSSEPAPPSHHPFEATEDKGTHNTGTYLDYPPQGDIPSNPFADPEPLSPPLEEPTPLETPWEEPVIATAQTVRYSQASMSPPGSPTHARAPSNIPQMVLGQRPVTEAAEPMDISPPPTRAASQPRLERHESPARPIKTALAVEAPTPSASLTAIAPVPTPPPRSERRESEMSGVSTRRGSDISGKRMGGWTSFFRRNGAKRKSTDRGRTPPSEASFSNTSRESMSRQGPPAHLQQPPPPPIRARSGTPVRTQSKFREDLPERMPLSPPDSRVQSPEVPPRSAARPIPPRKGYTPAAINADAGPSSPLAPARTDSPVSPSDRAPATTLMSQSLASVDSEGSWLAGKPTAARASLRAAQQQARHSAGSASMGPRWPQPHEPFSASYEELGIPDDEYFRRLTPAADGRAWRGSAGSMGGLVRKPSSTAMGPVGVDEEVVGESDEELEEDEEMASSPAQRGHGEEEEEEGETIVHQAVGRQPTVVHREGRVKSREGLLNEFRAGLASSSSSSSSDHTFNLVEEEEGSEERESPGEEEETSPLDMDADVTQDFPSPPGKERTWVVQRARSVDLGKNHVRHLSAGSAKLLDIHPSSKRRSGDGGGHSASHSSSHSPAAVTPAAPLTPSP